MKLKLTLALAAIALAATSQAATFDQRLRPSDNVAAKLTANQIDTTKKAPLILVADYTPAQKPQIALFDAKKAKTGAFAIKPLEQQQYAVATGAGKAVDFKKLGQVNDMGGANKVSGTTQQQADGTSIAKATDFKRGMYGQDAGYVAS